VALRGRQVVHGRDLARVVRDLVVLEQGPLDRAGVLRRAALRLD
jgi:hypothetical protein